VRATLGFLWDFAVGDDWFTALGIALALAATALAARSTSSVWWIMPLAVLVLLALYLWRAVRASRPPPEE
jgi:hypothetical protein